MKLMFAVLFLSSFAYAGLVELPRTPKPQFIDMEADTNVTMSVYSPDVRKVVLTIECTAASNNAMRVNLGKDVKLHVGKRSFFDIVDFIAGWDAGQWIVEDMVGGNQVEMKPVGESSRRKFSLEWTLDKDGKAVSLKAWEGETLLDAALEKRLSNVFSKDWKFVRIVRNGMTEPNEKIQLEMR